MLSHLRMGVCSLQPVIYVIGDSESCHLDGTQNNLFFLYERMGSSSKSEPNPLKYRCPWNANLDRKGVVSGKTARITAHQR